jgi:preprotein translocase SecE subunit
MKKAINYLKSVVGEIKQVEFPDRRQTIKMSNIVILISAIFTVAVMGLDSLFSLLRNLLTTI